MAKYSLDCVPTSNANDTTMLGLTSDGTVRPKIYDILISSRAAPNDYAAGYNLNRVTAAGTSTAVVAQALDPADAAAATVAGETYTIEPTKTAGGILLAINHNMRATIRWVAAPGGELISPATAANGVACVAQTPTTAFAVVVCIHFEE